MKGHLQVSTGSFALPESLVTERVGVVGSSGYGKTHLLTVIAEELLEQNLPVVIIDPEGVFGGLRSSFDGKRPGYKIAVLGGREGDIALEPTAGAAIADVVVATRQPMVLDFSNFEEEDEETAFVDAFCQRIYATNPRMPLHVIIDEIDKFAPEVPSSKRQMGSTRSVKNLVQRGRNRALGTTIASQRPAVIKKDVLYQVRCLFAFNLGGPLDQDAIAKWMLRNAEMAKAARDNFMASLPKLPRGTAWCWSPAWLNAFEQVSIRERRTFDSSKTPELADLTRQRTKQHVDLSELQTLMAATIQQANEEDPDRLRDRIRQLEKELTEVKRGGSPERLEVSIFTEKELALLEEAVRQADKEVNIALNATAKLEEMVRSLSEASQRLQSARSGQPRGRARTFYLNEQHELPRTTKGQAKRERAAAAKAASPAPVAPRHIPTEPSDVKLKKGAREMIAHLAAFGGELTRAQLANMARIKAGGTTMTSYLSNLRLAGYIVDKDKGDIVALTPSGTAYAGPQKRIRPDELLDRWRKVLKRGAREMLDLIIAAGADGIPRDALAAKLGIDPKGTTITSYLSNLRTNGLMTDPDGEQCFMGEGLKLLHSPRRVRRAG
jgi:uncharacterized protein